MKKVLIVAAVFSFLCISADAQIRSSRLATVPQSRPATAQPQTVGAALSVTTAQAGVPSISLSATNHPQVAQYTVFVPADGQVWADFGPTVAYGQSTFRKAAPSGGGSVTLYVAGMKPFTMYHLRLNVAYTDGSIFRDIDRTFTTGGLTPDRMPTISVTSAAARPEAEFDPQPYGYGHNAPPQKTRAPRLPPRLSLTSGTPAPGVELVSGVLPLGNQIEVFAVDLSGSIVWYYDFPKALGIPNPVKQLANGDFMVLIGPVPATPANGAINVLREIDLAGNTVSEFTLADLQTAIHNAGLSYTVGNMHHDFLVLPNGHIVVLVDSSRTVNGKFLVGDGIVELDQDHNVVWLWDAFDHLDTSRFPYGFAPSFDWTHANALVYLPATGDLLMSSRHQSWIVKIDYKNGAGSGDVLWRFGFGGDFSIASGNPADFAYGQHNPRLISQSGSQIVLNVFDDGNFRVDAAGHQCTTTCFSRNVIYSLDESTMVATQLFQFTPGVFSQAVGASQLLSNGDLEGDFSFITPPFSARVVETTVGPNPRVVWQMNINGEDAYRAERIPSLYPGVIWNSQ